MKEEKKTEYQTYMVRYYDDGHEDGNVLGKFKIIKEIFEDWYSGEWLAVREDGIFGLLKEREISGMYNPKNGGSEYSFKELGTKEEVMKRFE